MTRLCVLGAAAFALSRAFAAGVYLESTSGFASKRTGRIARHHAVWLTEERFRFDDSGEGAGRPLLTTLVRFDTGEILLANHAKKTFIRLQLKDVGGALLELGETMERSLARGVLRTQITKEIGGRSCTQCRFHLGQRRTPVTAWVEVGSDEVFQAVRALARGAAQKMGGYRAPLVVTLGSLRGLPREVSVGEAGSLQLTWRIDRSEQRDIRAAVFDLPGGFREDAAVPAETYILPEHVLFAGEVTAAYFAPSPARRHRSLLPREFTLTTEKVLEEFYKGRPGAEQAGIFRWARPLAWYLAPELWRYPLSGRLVAMLTMVGASFRHGALEYFPTIEAAKRPAN